MLALQRIFSIAITQLQSNERGRVPTDRSGQRDPKALPVTENKHRASLEKLNDMDHGLVRRRGEFNVLVRDDISQRESHRDESVLAHDSAERPVAARRCDLC